MMTDTIRKQIAEASLHSLGAGIAWQSLLQKRPLKIGFMGGSVTQGFAGDSVQADSYPALVTAALHRQGLEAEAYVCAEAGMGSVQGNLLADEWILAYKPDLVFLEFAINETTLRPSVMAFESLLRKLLLYQEPPAVCLFLIRNINDYSCESFMLPLAEHYHLPCVRLRPGMNAALASGDLLWSDYGDAESHPNAAGHRLLADCLLHLFDAARSATETAPYSLPEPWLAAPYAALQYLHPAVHDAVETNAEIVRRSNLYFPAAWDLCSGSGTMRITAVCRSLMIFYETHHLPEYGSCRVYVDGAPLNPPVLHSSSIYGWGNARFVIAVSEEKAAAHTVLLGPLSAHVFVLGFGIC